MMETNVIPPSAPRSTQPCCNSAYDSHPKMLHNLLYNFSQMNGYSSPLSPSRMSPMSPVAMAASAAAAAVMASSSHHSSVPSGSPASSNHETNVSSQRPTPIHRPRSGSVVSLGSTGSSIRDSYSPSHESSTSHDSFSRGSPASIGSSPSPSPPAHEGSKLFGLLKGTVTSPYGSLYNSVGSHHNSRSYTQSRPLNRTPLSSSTLSSPSDDQADRYRYGSLKRPLTPADDDQPIDLSCKKPRSTTETPPTSPLSSSSPLASPASESEASSGGSILKSILCGGGSFLSPSLFSSSSQRSHHHTSSSSSSVGSPAPSSPRSPLQQKSPIPSRRESTSSVSSVSSSASVPPRCSNSRSRVALAKKMMLPVRARVSDWMMKVVQFAKSQPEFASLPTIKDKLALVYDSWARILLLFMAETNFEFAVTPIHGEEEDGKGWDPECPTMQSVQSIQTFITKCQTLNLDSKEYHLMRMAVLFHRSPPGMENGDFVDKVNSYVRQSLQDHISSSRPLDKRRYPMMLMCIHTLYGINCKMVENLFCRHVLQNGEDMETMLKNMLETYNEDTQ